MKAEIISEDLKTAVGVLGIAQSAIKTDNTRVKILKTPNADYPNVALMVAGDRVAIEHRLAVVCDEEVEFGIPLSKIKALATDPPATTVRLSNSTTGLNLKCGTYQAKINIPLLESCPTFQPDQPCDFTIKSGAQLAGALKKIKGSIYTDAAGIKQAARKVIDGVMFEGDGKLLKLYSTDNNRVAKAILESNLESRFVIPKDAVIATHQLLDLEDNKKVFMGMRVNETTGDVSGFMLSIGNTRLTSSIMAGDPPNIDEFFSRELPNEIDIDCSVLKKSIMRILAFSDDHAIKLDIDVDGSILVSSAAQMVGEAQEKIQGGTNKGAARRLLLNAAYLLDACAGAKWILLENNDAVVRVSHAGCPYDTQHVIAQLRQ